MKKKNNILEDTSTSINNTGKFFNWIQEFSKKIVTITFIIFVIIELYSLVLLYLSYLQTSDISLLGTLISESHLTFREVIGGYIIKAACENAVKISGSIINSYLDKKYGVNIEDNVIEDEDPEESETDEEEIGG